jgi:hypothetical protein
MLVLLANTTSLFAQITREQADAIVWEYLQNELSTPYLLYVNTNLPNEEGINITTKNEENVKVKYACWAYYLNEFPNINGPSQHRYFLVKVDNGNLLEIITTNDVVPNLTDWESLLGVNDLKKEAITVYPNPTTGELSIRNYELGITNIEIYDIYGRKQSFNHLISKSSNHLINITNLSAGVYFLKISTETGMLIQKVIKH